MNIENADARRQRGMTIIEVLIALFILFVVMTAVLELFSLSYAVSLGAKARTDMMYRAERVVETLRWQRALQNAGIAVDTACVPLTGSTYTIPTSGSCYTSFWGPTGAANVIDATSACSVSYTFSGTQVTVVVTPLTTGSYQYMGPAARKAVRYVAQL